MILYCPDYKHLLEFRLFDAYRMPGPLEEGRILPHLVPGAEFTTKELSEKTRLRGEELFKVLCWYWTQRRVDYVTDETGKPVGWKVLK